MKNEEGFTLIELMIVVAIIGVLAGLSVPLLATQQKNAINAEVRSEVRATVAEIKTMLVKYPVATDTIVSFTRTGRFTDVVNNHKISSDNVALQIGGTARYNASGSLTSVDSDVPSWKSYYVLGYDTIEGSYNYVYDSKTKKFTELVS